jgi:putative membrane protein insertion efficiency factor
MPELNVRESQAKRGAAGQASSGTPGWLRATLRAADDACCAVLVFCVRVYQWTLSPWIGRQCRFEPTCSNYFIGAVRKHGAIVGAWRGVKRICRCHPLYRGNWFDPP